MTLLLGHAHLRQHLVELLLPRFTRLTTTSSLTSPKFRCQARLGQLDIFGGLGLVALDQTLDARVQVFQVVKVERMMVVVVGLLAGFDQLLLDALLV